LTLSLLDEDCLAYLMKTI